MSFLSSGPLNPVTANVDYYAMPNQSVLVTGAHTVYLPLMPPNGTEVNVVALTASVTIAPQDVETITAGGQSGLTTFSVDSGTDCTLKYMRGNRSWYRVGTSDVEGGGGGVYGSWQWVPDGALNPSWGAMDADNASASSATMLAFNDNSRTGQNFSGPLRLLDAGGVIGAQSDDDIDSWAKYNITGPSVHDPAGFTKIPVSLVATGSSPVSGWSSVSAIFLMGGEGGGGGGGGLNPIITDSFSWDASVGDLVLAQGSGGNTIYAPDSPSDGDMFGVVSLVGGQEVDINGNGLQIADGLGAPATLLTTFAGESVLLVYSGDLGYWLAWQHIDTSTWATSLTANTTMAVPNALVIVPTSVSSTFTITLPLGTDGSFVTIINESNVSINVAKPQFQGNNDIWGTSISPYVMPAKSTVTFMRYGTAYRLIHFSQAPITWSSLPASPVDGQVIDYLADATNGVVWRLRYRAASSSSYKWEFIGGAPLFKTIDTDEAFAAGATFVNPTTAGPDVTAPLNGDFLYLMTAGLYIAGQTAAGAIAIGLSVGGAAPVAKDQALTPASGGLSMVISKNGVVTGMTAGNAFRIQYNSATAMGGTPHARFRALQITPIRVG
jgi:hypothetical protein